MASQRPTKDDPAAPAAPPDWRRLRLWHIQPVRDILVLALVFGILYLGYILRPITVPMLLALLLAYLFEPLVQRITRSRRFSRQGAALIIIATFFLVVIVPIGVGFTIGITQAVTLVRSVGSNAANLVQAVTASDAQKQSTAAASLPPAWHSLYDEMREYREYIVERRRQEGEQQQKDETAEHPAPAEKPVDPATSPPPATQQPESPSRPTGSTTDAEQKDDALADRADRPAARVEDGTPANGTPLRSRLTEFKKQLYDVIFSGIEWTRANADNLAKSLGQQAIVTGSGAIATVLAGLSALAFLAFSAFLTAFFFFFFCTGWGKVLDFWSSLIPERKKGKAFDLIAKMDRVIAGFVRGRLTICAIMMGVFTLAYWLIGVPVPFLVGPLVGLLFMVPFLHVISIPLGIILLWLQPSALEWQNTWWWIIFAPIGVDVLGQFLDDWVLSPVIQGKTTEMDMPTILFASMAGGALAGMYGLLVAIPVAACIRILVKELFWPRFRKWARGEERDFLPISSADDPTQPGVKKS